MRKDKSFTIIELLVVIAVIGFLTSIVAVKVNSARDKAKIAKSIQFSQSIYHALGSEAVGYWDFNEIIGGNTVRDVSGNGNTGTLFPAVNGPALVDSLVFSGGNLGKALSFDGVNDYISVPSSQSLDSTPGDLISAITIEAWIKPNTVASAPDFRNIAAKKGNIDWEIYGLLTDEDQTNVYFYIARETAGVFSIDASLKSDKWQHVVGTYQGLPLLKGELNIYVDGEKRDGYGLSGYIGPSTKKLFMGGGSATEGSSFSAYYFDGLIDEVRIYKQALTIGQIQKHYAEGLEKHRNLTMK